ncbi:PAS domain-containing sensor histidine kinase [Pontibacter harenae]|uniref:PAS domain-containing sensor histidine kinase n=1 Tax=Pontibacter harenae TaxID=2894083 RepID=UPI001E3CED59|nr:PAS domain-containing sensor histidine kinase [Pontibacter harenae]MCC9165760.1 PAS domain-containing sensor histidine kinase [Pontibacter harenae]
MNIEENLIGGNENFSKTEDQYKLLVDGVRDYAIIMLSPEGYVLTWNAGAERMKGYTAEEIKGKHFSLFYPEEALKIDYPAYELEQAKLHGRFEDEGWRIKKDGSAFWAFVIITAIYDEFQNIIGFSKVTRDLTERKSLEDRLHNASGRLVESEEKFKLLIEGVKDYAIFMLDTEGYIQTWNKGAEHIKGYKAEEIIGKHFSIFYPEEDIQREFPQYELAKAVKDGRFEDEGWRIRSDKKRIWANVVITALFNSYGTHVGFTKVTRDLSERRRNEELTLKNKELQKINADLDNFIYTASHDLKSPIANLEGLVDMLKFEMGSDQQKYAEILQRVDSSISRLGTVISDLTEISRTQNEILEAENVNLPTLIAEIKSDLANLITSKDAVVQTDFSGFDNLKYIRKNLRSIFLNLISNAIKYASPDRRPVVSIKTEKSGADTYIVSVTDNGLGIEKRHKQKIFGMFKRAHSHVEGSGLGLYLVKRILENSGDSIKVDSELGVGSTFTITFKVPAYLK